MSAVIFFDHSLVRNQVLPTTHKVVCRRDLQQLFPGSRGLVLRLDGNILAVIAIAADGGLVALERLFHSPAHGDGDGNGCALLRDIEGHGIRGPFVGSGDGLELGRDGHGAGRAGEGHQAVRTHRGNGLVTARPGNILRRGVGQPQLHGIIRGNSHIVAAVRLLHRRHSAAVHRCEDRGGILEIVGVLLGHLGNQVVDALPVGLACTWMTRTRVSVFIVSHAGAIAPHAQDAAKKPLRVGVVLAILHPRYRRILNPIQGSLIAPLTTGPNLEQKIAQHIVPVIRIVKYFKAFAQQSLNCCKVFVVCPIADNDIGIEREIRTIFALALQGAGVTGMVNAIVIGQRLHALALDDFVHGIDHLRIGKIIVAVESTLICANIEHGAALTGKVRRILLQQSLSKGHGRPVRGFYSPVRRFALAISFNVFVVIAHSKFTLGFDHGVHMTGSVKHRNDLDTLAVGIGNDGVHITLAQLTRHS